MTGNKLIGEILIDMGLASRELIIDCLNMQTEFHRRGLDPVPIGRLLVMSGRVSPNDLDKALEEQSKYRLPS